ncbi:MAG TPA: trehalose-phosphatase [Kofleriaceae bacterium]|nr:trehalose-phosphatase [Kofleriaceae bacterium]
MKHILSRDHVRTLDPLAGARVLLAFDFDGTLAPIVADRERAAMRRRTHALLAAAAELYPCAVISGRARGDVAARLGSIPVKYVVGNHGMEHAPDPAGHDREIALARPLLERALAVHPGIEIEDKRYSLSIHYRASPRKRAARGAIDAAIAALPRPMRVIAGKLVANVVPAGARHKGTSLLELRERERADIAVYVGDDVTDEDAFALHRPGQVLAMRVGRARASAAPFYLRDQREIDRLLVHVVKLRDTPAPSRARPSGDG